MMPKGRHRTYTLGVTLHTRSAGQRRHNASRRDLTDFVKDRIGDVEAKPNALAFAS
jgi:hypothetical protein